SCARPSAWTRLRRTPSCPPADGCSRRVTRSSTTTPLTTTRKATENELAQVARRFLVILEDSGHLVVPTASLVAEAPTLAPVNDCWIPFKPNLLGQRTPPSPRMTSAQKCVRTPDIDEVGKTTRHATFFQMLGNFSIGDYFKEGAIPFAWELLTRPQADGGFGF